MSVVINGSAGVTTNSGAVLGITSGTAVASTSGTSIDFTSIPAWVKRVTLMLDGVSTNGTSNLLLQLGAGSVTTTGYLGSGGNYTNSGSIVSNYTTGFGITASISTAVLNGSIVFTLISGNTWIANGNFGRSDNTVIHQTAGRIALGGTLDRVRITTVNGTDTFDAGSINILYE